MSTFITGVPGTGKTAQVVAELKERLDKKASVSIYQHGIREFSLPHIQVYCRSDACLACRDAQLTESSLWAEDWHVWGQAGDLIVLDEVQRIWPPRNVATKRPKSVAMLETHRHFGVEFWLMTQHPKLVDADVRRQMRRHLHMTAGWAGRKLYEWDTVSEDLKLSSARERPFKLPAGIFSLYKSADAHVVITRKKPLSFYAMIGAVILAVLLSIFVVYRIKSRLHPAASEAATTAPAGGVASAEVGSAHAFPDFTPVIPNVPESAPAYAKLVKVQAVPFLAGCIQSAKGCKCYTQQATPYPTVEQYCREVVANHRFNPYRPSAAAVPDSNLDDRTSPSSSRG
jgi:zona occludens toxin